MLGHLTAYGVVKHKYLKKGREINLSGHTSTLHITAVMPAAYSLQLFIGGTVKARFVFIRTAMVCLFLKRVRLKYGAAISVR